MFLIVADLITTVADVITTEADDNASLFMVLADVIANIYHVVKISILLWRKLNHTLWKTE